MAGKKNPNLGDKLRQEREGAENTLRDSRSKTADSSTGDGGKKKAEHRRQIRHEADLAKMRSKKLKSEQEVKAKKNAAASGKKGGKPKKPGTMYCPMGQRMKRLSDAKRIKDNGFVDRKSVV